MITLGQRVINLFATIADGIITRLKMTLARSFAQAMIALQQLPAPHCPRGAMRRGRGVGTMAVSARVKDDERWDEMIRNPDDKEDYYIKETYPGKFRVYRNADYYSQTSGGVGMLGTAMRDADDRIINFPTMAVAIRWIEGGCRIYMPDAETMEAIIKKLKDGER